MIQILYVPVAFAIDLHDAVAALVPHEHLVRRAARHRDDLEELRSNRIRAVRHVAVGPEAVVHGKALERRGAGAHEEEPVLAARHPDVASLIGAHPEDVMRTAVLRSVEGPAGGRRRGEIDRWRGDPDR